MNDIELAIHQALESQGNQAEVNKAYLAFMKANFFIPIEKKSADEEPNVLFLTENDKVFMPVFSQREYLQRWAQEISEQIDVLHLTGANLLGGVGDNVTVCFNIGTPTYKEFNPGEIARMRSMLIKIGLIQGKKAI